MARDQKNLRAPCPLQFLFLFLSFGPLLATISAGPGAAALTVGHNLAEFS